MDLYFRLRYSGYSKIMRRLGIIPMSLDDYQNLEKKLKTCWSVIYSKIHRL